MHVAPRCPLTLALRLTLLLALVLTATGCRLATRDLDPVRYYDFGVPEPSHVDPCCARRVALDSVAYAPMLSGQTMWYREGGGSVQPQAFAVSRWSASPAALLEQYIRVSLGIGQSDRRAPLPFQLSLKLETMEQLFADDGHSEARLTVSAALTRAEDRALLDSRVFALTEKTSERSPAGGARAMAGLVREFGRELQRWTCRTIDGPAEGSGEDPGSQCPGAVTGADQPGRASSRTAHQQTTAPAAGSRASTIGRVSPPAPLVTIR